MLQTTGSSKVLTLRIMKVNGNGSDTTSADRFNKKLAKSSTPRPFSVLQNRLWSKKPI